MLCAHVTLIGLSPRTSHTSVAGASRRAVMLCEVSSNRAGSKLRVQFDIKVSLFCFLYLRRIYDISNYGYFTSLIRDIKNQVYLILYRKRIFRKF